MFNKYPINPVRQLLESNPLRVGYESIIENILANLETDPNRFPLVVIDGTHGVDYQKFLQPLIATIEKQGYTPIVHSTAGYIKSGEALREQFAVNITDNRAFGYVVEADISAYFVDHAQSSLAASLQKEDSTGKKVAIVFGPGAYWLTEGTCDVVYFLDLSREAQQTEYKKNLLNFGMTWNRDFVEKYKIAYFVEWPILETYRKKLLSRIDVYVDMNNPNKPVTTTGAGLKAIIAQITKAPMRVKPFFAPGVWGGQYLKDMADLPEDWINCAWGFEPIAPENSILIGYEDTVIEVPFLIIMALEHTAIMGNRSVGLFGDYFPVRFDYLDTIDGDNLSCQVHPKQDYVRKQFNELMTQQESYYIMEKKGDSKVYLGLTENSTKEGFLNAVVHSQETAEPMPFTDYVNEFDSEKGDLFLIPTGTVHCSGKDNLVLEISSTTWWFTFKIYDYLRKDLDGKPRPVNIDHGFENIDFHKKTDWVKGNLIPEPQLIQQQGENEEYLLGQRDDLLFYVKRIHLHTDWQDHTNDEFVMYNLVEGEKVRIVSCDDTTVFVELAYAESYILPSVFGSYKIVNLGSTPCKLIKAGVSPDWDVSFIES
ncbi:class I mannose-6-phosphate isomerase [Bacillus sp. sid0103]|uniref:class I mannose-6-phosphate isomerase n=1 Tax=Bacillus sp. sid0103 TaxID=2856337 RepID=UPI001C4524DF|nr:class I mannose-6-phosphate isomerase [Bacillus sp. sid0103]MBV7504363.1 class I mannose-6-phosphate isomerase [Bacillus sp. sid0103]